MNTTTIKREMLHVTTRHIDAFKIPIGVDLNDTSQVKKLEWGCDKCWKEEETKRLRIIEAMKKINEYIATLSEELKQYKREEEKEDCEDDDEYDCEDDDEYDCEDDCDDCPECGKGLTDLYHKRDLGYVGDMICDACSRKTEL